MHHPIFLQPRIHCMVNFLINPANIRHQCIFYANTDFYGPLLYSSFNLLDTPLKIEKTYTLYLLVNIFKRNMVVFIVYSHYLFQISHFCASLVVFRYLHLLIAQCFGEQYICCCYIWSSSPVGVCFFNKCHIEKPGVWVNGFYGEF